MRRIIGGVVLLLFAVVLTACTHGPTEPTGFGVPVTFTYRSVVPATMPWPTDTCGDPANDRRPSVVLNWNGGEVAMEPDLMDPSTWRATAMMPPNMYLDVSLRDPGLCRASFAPYGEFAWSGVAVNGTPLPSANVTYSSGRAPCFGFRVTSDGEIELDKTR